MEDGRLIRSCAMVTGIASMVPHSMANGRGRLVTTSVGVGLTITADISACPSAAGKALSRAERVRHGQLARVSCQATPGRGDAHAISQKRQGQASWLLVWHGVGAPRLFATASRIALVKKPSSRANFNAQLYNAMEII